MRAQGAADNNRRGPQAMSDDLRTRALKLYHAPFRYESGYIWDARKEMVADDHVEEAFAMARVRGWGRIGYLEDAPALQDEVGKLIAEALTKFWQSEFQKMKGER